MIKPFVQTVRGPIAPEELGLTLMHEHLTCDWPFALGATNDRLETVPVLNRVISCLETAQAEGLTAFVDVGTERFGPSPLMLLNIASRTQMHIVCSTGVFADDNLPPPGWVLPPATVDTIYERLLSAVTLGQARSGVKPGVLKIGSSGVAITDNERRVFAAAARTQKDTGLAITTHTQLSLWGEQQIDILEAAGADLDRVIIGHIGWGSSSKDADYHKRLVARGVTVGIDVIGAPVRPISEFVDIAMDLIEAGYESQIIFSHDRIGFSRGLYETFGPDWLSGDYGVVSREFLPQLRERGVSNETIDLIMRKTPQRILTIDPDRYPGCVDTVLKTAEVNAFGPYDYAWA